MNAEQVRDYAMAHASRCIAKGDYKMADRLHPLIHKVLMEVNRQQLKEITEFNEKLRLRLK